MKPKYFKSPSDFRHWLELNHARETELWVGFFNRASGKGGLTYPEALDEALCFGWIDGLKKRVDEFRYTQRFTPRRPTSTWSLVNVRHVERLTQAGRMSPAGLQAFAARKPAKTGIYSFENPARSLSPELERQFQSESAAWNFFQRQPPGYRRTATWWVMSAKQEETRARRVARLIADSRQERRLGLISGRK